MENRSPTNTGRWMGRGYGEGRGEGGWRSILATPWDENHWPPTEHPFPSSLPIKSWLCFLWPSGPLNTSQDPAAMDDKITQFWLRSFNGNSAGKGSLPPPGNRGRRWRGSYFTPSPTLDVDVVSSGSSCPGTMRQRSGDSQGHLPFQRLKPTDPAPQPLLLNVTTVRKENPPF